MKAVEGANETILGAEFLKKDFFLNSSIPELFSELFSEPFD